MPTVKTEAKFARAKFSWKSDHARDLVFKKGEIIEVLDGKPNAACPAAVFRSPRADSLCNRLLYVGDCAQQIHLVLAGGPGELAPGRGFSLPIIRSLTLAEP